MKFECGSPVRNIRAHVVGMHWTLAQNSYIDNLNRSKEISSFLMAYNEILCWTAFIQVKFKNFKNTGHVGFHASTQGILQRRESKQGQTLSNQQQVHTQVTKLSSLCGGIKDHCVRRDHDAMHVGAPPQPSKDLTLKKQKPQLRIEKALQLPVSSTTKQ